MAVPQSCTVLVIGGGPAGSYAAAALAREGIDTVVLEAEKFPRYHIGESTLPSLRQFFGFIDFYDKVNAYGFYRKDGAVFRLNQSQPDAATDFLAAGGPEGYAWNLLRSESDDLLFRHAGESGARIFDETRVDSVKFEPDRLEMKSSPGGDGKASAPGRPTSASWSRKDGTSGTVRFCYLVDASGRHGILSTKYLKSRKFNKNFKNVASWGYWKTNNVYGRGTHMEGWPYFEALNDASGWCWLIPLHDGTCSVGVVQDQQMAADKKRELNHPSAADFYEKSLELAVRTKKLLAGATLVSDVKSASDWSYASTTYHIPYARICGDAGCFIDPLFSSGYHLAITGGLSAAVTIAASLRGEYDEQTAGSWHSKKTVESYTRFVLAAGSATTQIRSQELAVMQDIDEDGFQRAFDLLAPIIQGTVDVDVTGKISRSKVSQVLDFCYKAFNFVPPEKKAALFEKLRKLGLEHGTEDYASAEKAMKDARQHLTDEEWQIVKTLQSRRMIREDLFEMDCFTLDAIDGLTPRLERGKLGLMKAQKVKLGICHFYSPPYLDGIVCGVRQVSP